MVLARVVLRVITTEKHPACAGRTLYVVRGVRPDGTETGDEWIAVDAVGSGPGDTVVCGGAPGVAQEVFGLDRAPIRTLIVAIVDKIECRG